MPKFKFNEPLLAIVITLALTRTNCRVPYYFTLKPLTSKHLENNNVLVIQQREFLPNFTKLKLRFFSLAAQTIIALVVRSYMRTVYRNDVDLYIKMLMRGM